MRRMRLVFTGLVLVAGNTSADTVLFGPTEYLSEAESPWIEMSGLVLEDFENGVFNVAGVTASAGSVIGPATNVDSVDGDDGEIDGLGQNGHSFFNPGSTGILFTFDAGTLGRLPTHAGIVWTDGPSGGNIFFEAFDASGASLGTLHGAHADAGFHGTTAEDRFYGVSHGGGVSAIFIESGGSLEVDHLQFIVPTPAAAWLLACVAIGTRRRR